MHSEFPPRWRAQVRSSAQVDVHLLHREGPHAMARKGLTAQAAKLLKTSCISQTAVLGLQRVKSDLWACR